MSMYSRLAQSFAAGQRCRIKLSMLYTDTG